MAKSTQMLRILRNGWRNKNTLGKTGGAFGENGLRMAKK